MQGHLKTKSNSFFSGYYLYYYSLKEGSLLRFKTPQDAKPAEVITLKPPEVSTIIDGESLSGKKHSIAIFFAGKSPMVLVAPTENEYHAWLKNLQHTLSSAIVGSNEYEKQQNDEAFLQTIESFNDGCVVSDSKCIILAFNKAAEQLFGHNKEDVIGKSVTMLMPDVYSKAHEGYVNKYLKSGNKKLIGEPRQMIGKHKDQTTFPVHLTYVNLNFS